MALQLAALVIRGYPSPTDMNEADRCWICTVKRLLRGSVDTLVTPFEHRAQLARQIARQLGRRVRIARTERGFRIEASASGRARR